MGYDKMRDCTIKGFLFNMSTVGIYCSEDGVTQEEKEDIVNSLNSIKDEISNFIEMNGDLNNSMGMFYIKLASIIKCIGNKKIIDKTLNVLKNANKKFELTPENIDIYANLNKAITSIKTSELGDIVNVAISLGGDTVESAYTTLKWLMNNNLTDVIVKGTSVELLSQALTVAEFADRVDARIECVHCNKVKKISKFDVGSNICKKCLTDNLVKAKLEESLANKVNIEQKGTNNNQEIIKEVPKNNSYNTKPRYMKDKKVANNTKDKIKEYLEENKEKQEDKKLSQFLDDLYSNKLYISIDKSLNKHALRDELFKYVETLETEQSVLINTPKIIFVAKHCLESGELLTNLIHDLHLKNNHISEYINIRNIVVL